MNFIMKTHFPCIFTFLFGVSALQAQTITDFAPRNGKEGTPITITGTGFTGRAVEVAFGNSAFVPATVNSDTEITANVPADASAGKVSVRVDGGTPVESPADLDGNGTPNEETDNFRYVSITSFSPMEASVDEKITFTGTGFATRYNPVGSRVHLNVYFSTSCRSRSEKIISSTSAEIFVPACANSGDISIELLPNVGEEEPEYNRYTFVLPGFVLNPPRDVIINSFSPAAAAVGQAVQITGVGFSLEFNNRVTFSGDDATAYSDLVQRTDGVRTLTAYVPAKAENGKITVKVLSKTAETPADFTVLTHTVEDFNPKAFRPGHEITITGTNFARYVDPQSGGQPPTHDNEVCFSSKCLDHNKIDVNDKGTKLTLNVPNNIPETGTIKVRVGKREVDMPGRTYTLRPAAELTFTDFDPKEARMGQTVTLIGTGFEQKKDNDILLRGTDGTLTPAINLGANEDQTQLKIRITTAVRGLESVINKIRVRKCIDFCDGRSPQYQREELGGFSVLETPTLAITGIPSEPVFVGQEITITGEGFSLHAPDNEVLFGARDAALATRAHEVNAEGTELKVRVNSKARDGTITVFFGINATGFQAISSEGLTIIKKAPKIMSFTPTSGSPGDTITINGANFARYAKYNEVSFAYAETAEKIRFVAAHWVNADGTQLKAVVGKSTLPDFAPDVPVPDPIPPLSVAVRIADNPGIEIGVSSDDFTFNDGIENKLVVSSFSPTEGEVGTEVTITGENFSDNPAENTVTFGGKVKATPSASTTTSITVKVPAGARTGPIKVTLDEQTGTSEATFTVPGTEPVPPPNPNDILSIPGVEGSVHVYPNPASQEVRLTNLPAAAHTYRVYSLAGKVALTGAARDSAAIDVSGLARGQYVLVLQAEDGSETLRTRLLLVK